MRGQERFGTESLGSERRRDALTEVSGSQIFPLHPGARTSVSYAGARNGLNFRSALATKTKSLSVRPLILCDQILILHFPQARYRSG